MKIFRCRKSFAERRQIIYNIPMGVYCYKPVRYLNSLETDIEPCPYYNFKRERCDLIKCPIDDMLKSCGIRKRWI